MQPFVVARELERSYGDYIRSTFPFADPDLRAQVDRKIRDEHLLATGPIVSLQRPFAPGPSVAELRDQGVLHPDVAQIFGTMRTYRHQADALVRLSDRTGMARSAIVATGTGSGKTEAFLMPILDACVRHPGDGVRALLVYPMNALANDQLERLRRYLKGTGITFGRYTGDTRENEGEGRSDNLPPEECSSRDAIRRRRPNILITSYRMLEYLLIRRQDQPIFRPGGGPATLRYLVLDEVHTYKGALGAEVACLVRRLRGHLDLHGPALVCVGTSATVGQDQGDAVRAFASELFADAVDEDGLIEERYLDVPPPPASLPPLARLSDRGVAAVERLAERGDDEPLDLDTEVEEVLTALFDERAWPADRPSFTRALFAVMREHPVVPWLEHALHRPTALRRVVDDLLVAPGHDRAAREDVEREIAAMLTLGTLARDDEGALLRPRLHAFFRGLSHSMRCPWCGAFAAGGDSACADCGERTLPLELCRTCGQDYLRTALSAAAPNDRDADLRDGVQTRVEAPDELRKTGPAVIRLAFSFHRVAPTDEEDDESDDAANGEGTQADRHTAARYCTHCGFLREVLDSEPPGAEPCSQCGSERVRTLILAGRGPLRRCPNCHGRYGSREVITGLFSGTAIGVSILTWLLMGRLREAERRLLIFADSRQDTAYQAGYLADVTAEYAWRQVTYRMLAERQASGETSHDLKGFWTKLYLYGRDGYGIFSRDERERQENDLRWFLLMEFGRQSGRRSGLEPLGLVTCDYRGLEEIERHDEAYARLSRAARSLPRRPDLAADALQALLLGMLDIIRRAGALSDEYTLRLWNEKDPLRGLDDLNRRPTLFRKQGAPKVSYVKLRPVAGSSARRTAIEELFHRFGVEDPRAASLAATDLLLEEGLLIACKAGGLQPHQKHDGLAVNVGRLALVAPERVWQCTNCRSITPHDLMGLCPSAYCPDSSAPTLQPLSGMLEDNFYAAMYAMADPVRIEVREHSGQISGDRRMEYEEQFRSGKVNVLVASPTLELGVDIGALSTVLLRGLPPSPANYAQRAGRAGRRERIALVNAYAQSSPHDAFFFQNPERMVSGHIAVPAFDLDNREIVRRHIRALALEKLSIGLPTYMRDFLDIHAVEDPSPAQYVDSRVVGAVDAMRELAQKRGTVTSAVIAAFAADQREWLSAPFIHEVLEQFEGDLGRVLERWHAEVVEVAGEIARVNAIAHPSREEKGRRATLERTLEALTRRRGGGPGGGSADSYTLGYLSSHGFLPSYAFPGEAATLFAPEVDGGEVTRDPSIAIEEFAPENIVYVDRKKVVSDGFSLARSVAGSAESFSTLDANHYVRCERCDHYASAVWVGSCPRCGGVESALRQARVEVGAFRGHQIERIGAGEDARERKSYRTVTALLDSPMYAERFAYDGLACELRRRQPMLTINEGRLIDGTPSAFTVCLECGDVKPSSPQGDWEQRHRKRRRHEPVLVPVHLTYSAASDVVVLIPDALDGEALLTAGFAFLSGSSLAFDAAERELGVFDDVSSRGTGPRLTLYERIAGGAGYVRRIPGSLPDIARRALELIDHEQPCAKACYRCLLSYYNQRFHDRIDKRLVRPLLESLAQQSPQTGTPAPELYHPGGVEQGVDQVLRTQTAWESRLFEGISRRGLAGAVTQFEIREPGNGRVVTVPDVAFPEQRIAIYVDGALHHDTAEGRAHDLRVRSRAQELGWRVLVFPNARVSRDLDGCIDTIQDVFGEP